MHGRAVFSSQEDLLSRDLDAIDYWEILFLIIRCLAISSHLYLVILLFLEWIALFLPSDYIFKNRIVKGNCSCPSISGIPFV
jgi:hypothetical protein